MGNILENITGNPPNVTKKFVYINEAELDVASVDPVPANFNMNNHAPF